MNAEPSRLELLELDIDTRLVEAWALATQIEDWTLETVAAFMRNAYGRGYADALCEKPGERGNLCTEHGYLVPGR